MLVAIIAFVINLIGNWWLIPSLGATGAAISTCISFWFFFVLRTELAIYVWKPMPRLTLYSYTSILVIGAVLSSLYGEQYKAKVMIFWLLVLSSVVFSFKKELCETKVLAMSKLRKAGN